MLTYSYCCQLLPQVLAEHGDKLGELSPFALPPDV